ncbi:TPA: hypothetical protein RM919_002331 [Escherichia coli]|uniref:hypothetical protein n=1 Tax=Escherichia coli TaxID=562 RepID=UPI0006A5BD1C|nr:hypothetical protein [Escherichia coli]EEW7853625.1 hypothetical protein [Escherichia coli]EEY5685321.1 hypothetical protein [Escherichia coli]EFB4022132.1 hypothetical protein [Escherichia coli]EFB5529981.1 hypothetical protein [Escherichia coli]EFB6453739.1 hypothetical protein [Escherichia coli]
MNNFEFKPEATAHGIKIDNTTIDYVEAVQRLNDGEYDNPYWHGLRIMQCIAEADDARFLGRFSVDMKVAQWRWLYVATFISEEENKNGTIDIPNDNGTTDRAVIYKGKHGCMSIYPGPLRIALQNHVEWGFIEKYGETEGMGRVLFLYQKMLIADPDNGFILSAMGREGLELLLDEMINDLNTHGMPEAPVTH